jgi:uncharacterized protein
LKAKTEPRRKHVPLRTCIACRRTLGKRDLVRIVRSPIAGVVVDPTGKQGGRGAYLCHNRACWEQALAGGRLAAALKGPLEPAELSQLREFQSSLPRTQDAEG